MEPIATEGELAQRVYTSQLLGRDHTLVLHGGGNTSVKIRSRDALGEEEDILYVKGSGWDLETIREPGFAPVRLAYVAKLARLDSLSDPQMMNELSTQVTRAGAPAPSGAPATPLGGQGGGLLDQLQQREQAPAQPAPKQ